MSKSLVIDPDGVLDTAVAACRCARTCERIRVRDFRQARDRLLSGPFDAVVTRDELPGGDCLELLSVAREADPATQVVVLAADPPVARTVEYMRAGAFDVLHAGAGALDVAPVLRKACDRAELLRENARLQSEIRIVSRAQDIIGDGPAMHHVREQIAHVAPTDATVLICGETGTGKELVARAIHAGSRRAGKPFVAVNCAALSETLLESELFGHERGAFTGADRARQGFFEAAHEGTLLLDEAGEMPLSLQAKLLRVLMDGSIFRVGATRPRKVDVRIIAATHRDLQQRIAEGRFREDLFYRLAVFPLGVPPLRERREDLPALTEHFLRIVAAGLGVSPRDMAPAARNKLLRYHFPGNVRELRNIIERAYILARGNELTAADIIVPTADAAVGACGVSPPCYARAESWIDLLPEHGGNLREVLRRVEAGLIRRALEEAAGVQAEAARRLGVSRSDLNYKLKRLKNCFPAR